MGIHYIEDSELQKIVEAIKAVNKMAEDETFSGADMAELIRSVKIFRLLFYTTDGNNLYEITEEDLKGITYLRSYIFCNMDWLKKITIPETVTGWNNNLFNGCGNLEEVRLSSSMTGVGNSGFYGCKKLKKINVEKLTSVSDSGFRGCVELEKLDFHKLKSIQVLAFNGCTKLSTLIIRREALCTLANINALTGTPIANGTGFIYVPDNLVDYYKGAENWVTYANQIKPISELEEGAE